MADKDDVVLTMDVNQFEKSIAKVLEGFGLIEKGAPKSAEKGAKGMASAFAKGAVVANYAIKAIDGAIATIGANIPEIGKTFEISKDIIMRNLLWPLRKELIPLLQKVLNWVRDHRIMFVQMGTVIVSVFRMIKTVVGGFLTLVEGMWKHLAGGLTAIFGKTSMTITDMLNLVIFKISAIAIFIISILKPVFNWIGDQLSIAIAEVKDFFEGFIDGIGNLAPNLDDLKQAFGQLADMIGLSDQKANILGKTFRTLGEILGVTLKPLLAGIAETIERMVGSIDAIVSTVKWAKGKLTGNSEDAGKALKEFTERERGRNKRTVERWSDVGSNVKRGVGNIQENWSGNEVSNTGKAAAQVNKINNIDNKQTVNINISGAHDPNATARAVVGHIQSSKERQGIK